jgi:hypothetical protein
MKWDAGALSKYRRKSPKFRYLSNNPPPHPVWPKKWRDELGVFLATPGISWEWVSLNFNMSHQRLHNIYKITKHLHHLGWENVLTITHDDAVMYMTNRPFNGQVPFWACPFIRDDLGPLTWKQVQAKWNISEVKLGRIRNDKSSHIFHSFKDRRRGLNMARHV